jgi:hypothetical protein
MGCQGIDKLINQVVHFFILSTTNTENEKTGKKENESVHGLKIN